METIKITSDEKEFLKVVTEQHIVDIEKKQKASEPLVEYTGEESYLAFLEKLLKKLNS